METLSGVCAASARGAGLRGESSRPNHLPPVGCLIWLIEIASGTFKPTGAS
jgi:hypothetical protein